MKVLDILYVLAPRKNGYSLFLLLLVLAAIAAKGAVPNAKRPNIVFLFADDQRADAVGALGNQFIRTPSIDRLAAEGTVFTNAYCAGSFSGAVCVASRSSLMTGMEWHHIKDRKNWSGLDSLPSVLGHSGYATHIVGKWHNGEETLKRSFQDGSSVFIGGMCDHTKVPVVDLTSEGQIVNERVMDEFSSTGFANAAIDYIDNADSEKPFFLYVAFTAPHDVRNPPLSYRQYYYDNRPPLPANFLPQHPFNLGPIMSRGRDEGLAPWPRLPEMVNDQICEYYGLIEHLDNEIGRILESLDRNGLADDTIIVYSADHGLALGSHGLMGKQNLYEHSMRTPLILRGPGVPEGEYRDGLTLLYDLFPTLCEYAGIEKEPEVDGRSLISVVEGSARGVRDTLALSFQNNMRTFRNERFKLHVYPEINHEMLFDLWIDPLEQFDLSKDPKYADIKEGLEDGLLAWQKDFSDNIPLRTNSLEPFFIDLTGHDRTMDIWQPLWIREKYFDGRAEANHGPGKNEYPPNEK